MADSFHVVKLGTAGLDDVGRRVRQETTGHRGRSGDSLYGIRTTLRAGVESFTDRQLTRLKAAFMAHSEHDQVAVAWQRAWQLRSVYHQPHPCRRAHGSEKAPASFAACPIPEVARLGRTLRQLRTQLLAYFDTGGASNGGTEAINGLIELHRRVVRGFRNRANYRLQVAPHRRRPTTPPPYMTPASTTSSHITGSSQARVQRWGERLGASVPG